MIKYKKGQEGVYLFLIAVVSLFIFWLIYVIVMPIMQTFMVIPSADPITQFFIFVIPIWLLFMFTFSIFTGGMRV